MSPNNAAARRKPLAALVTAIVAVFCGGLVQRTQLLAPLDRAVLDAQAAWTQREVPTDAVIVEIDSRSLHDLGSWPWPRRYHAAVINALVAHHARRIFLDIDFSAASNPADDAELAQAVRTANGTIVLPAFWQPSSSGAETFLWSAPIEPLRAHAMLGSVNLAPGPDGLVREIKTLAPQAAYAVAPVAAVLASVRPAGANPTLLDYRIAPSSFRKISYADVLRNPAGLGDLSGRTVFVGASALELGDMVPVPVHRALPGVLLQAIAYETLRQHVLHTLSPEAMGWAIFLWAVAGTALMRSVRWRRLPLLAFGMLVATLLITFGIYTLVNIPCESTPLLATIVVVFLATLFSTLDAEAWRSWTNWLRYKRQDALLAEIVTHSADAIMTLDAAGQITTANPAAAMLFGRDQKALQGCSIDSLLPQARPLIEQQVQGRAQAVEFPLTSASGAMVHVELVFGRIAVESERIITATFRDITAQKIREQELRFHATHDALTGLPNRVYLSEQLADIVAAQRAGAQWALVLMDLDGFQQVNDTLGHSVGDLLLVELGKRFAALAPAGACVARLGGDEFAVLLKTNNQDSELPALCQSLLLGAMEPVFVKGVPISMGISAGVARYPQDANGAEALLQRADVALYAAKRKRSGIECYDPTTDNNTPRRLEILTLLRSAVARSELLLHYQPKIELSTGCVPEVEALLRWRSPELGNVSPGEFIPLAEASDLITSLTLWTLERALTDCREWHAAGVQLKVAVNLSARHLQDSAIPTLIEKLLHSTQAQAAWLELEITESAIMTDPDRALTILRALRDLGLSISIDDFGTGYSSLAYLQRLNVDRLKIDKSFVLAMSEGLGSEVIVASTIQLGHALGLEIIAEGVETAWQADTLRAAGCDYAQGYFYARPMACGALLAWCADQPVLQRTLKPQSSRSASTLERTEAALKLKRAP
jgi:diguanylate cyclase (GGDEF)-like protein/PAS domain S-box-containing protein